MSAPATRTWTRGWTQEQYHQWNWSYGLYGAFWAFVWLGTDWWFFGFCALASWLVSGWAWIEIGRQ